MKAAVCVAVAIACGFASPGNAHADDVAAAKRLYRRAERAYAGKDYSAALRLYLGAYQNKPLPGFLFNIAQCYRGLGRYDKAIEHFEAYLRRSDNRANKQTARGLLAECKRKRQRESIARRRGGAAETGAGVVVRSHGRPVAATGGSTLGDTEAPPRSVGASGARGARDGGEGLNPVYFWTAVGVTAALSVTTLITGVLALKLSDEFNDPATPRDDLPSTRDRGETMATAANTTFALTLVGAAASAGLYFFTEFSGTATKGATVTVAPDRGGGAVVVQGRF